MVFLTSLKKVLVEEKAYLEELSADFVPDYRQQVMQSFVDSPLMPRGSMNLLLMAEGVSDSEILNNIAMSAYDCFVSIYLEQVSAYAAQSVNELGVEVTSEMLNSFNSLDQMDHLINIFTKARTEDPVLEWFISDGAPVLSFVRKRLKINSISNLSALIRHLEYYCSLFKTVEDELESYSFIVDIPERIVTEFEELELLQDVKVAEPIKEEFTYELDPSNFIEAWFSKENQLINWEHIFLSINDFTFQNDINKYRDHCVEYKPTAQEIEKKQNIFTKSLLSDDEIDSWSENIKIEITFEEKGRRNTDGHADNTSPCAAA